MNYTSTSSVTAQYLGGGEQTRGFFQTLFPNEYDKAFQMIRQWIQNKRGFMDEFRLLGFTGGPLKTFMDRYIVYARENKTFVTKENLDTILWAMRELYPDYPYQDIHDYLSAVAELGSTGMINDAVYKPYTQEFKQDIFTKRVYETVKNEIINVGSKPVESASNKILIAGVVAGVSYLLLKSYGKTIIKSVAGRTRSYPETVSQTGQRLLLKAPS